VSSRATIRTCRSISRPTKAELISWPVGTTPASTTGSSSSRTWSPSASRQLSMLRSHLGGEKKVWHVVHIPSEQGEERRQPHRDLSVPDRPQRIDSKAERCWSGRSGTLGNRSPPRVLMHTKSHQRTSDQRRHAYIDTRRRVPVNDGVCPGFRGDVTQI
jgi:hypothetical protein